MLQHIPTWTHRIPNKKIVILYTYKPVLTIVCDNMLPVVSDNSYKKSSRMYLSTYFLYDLIIEPVYCMYYNTYKILVSVNRQYL